MGLSDADLDRMRRSAQHFVHREERAREISATVPTGRLYVALHGVSVHEDLVIVPGLARIRKVRQPPGLIEVTRAADPTSTDYLGVARHAGRVTAEIVMDETDWEPQSVLSVAWTIAIMLKLRGHPNIIAPFCAPVSADVVPTITDQTVRFRLLDDYTARLVVPGAATTASDGDAAWITERIQAALELRGPDSRRFSLAFEIYHAWNHTGDYRTAMTQTWAALEALFGKRDDKKVTAALCGRIAGWLPGTNADDVRALYDRRCDIVHGRPFDVRAALPDVYASADLLRRSLVRSIDTATRTLDDWK
jgi:hypothetical protein